MIRKLLPVLILFVAVPRVWAQESLPIPDGCDNPFVQSGIFGEFFEKCVESSLIETGTITPALVQLFAVDELRKHIALQFPNPADGDSIDRHVRAQICAYAAGKQNLNTASVDLQRHLLSIAPKLLRDTKKLATEAEMHERERQKLIAKLEARQGLIERAQKMARKEVSSLLTKN